MVDLSQYKNLYLEEARDYLQKLNTLFVTLEKNQKDLETLNQIMSVAHTFKGISATMGYNHIAELAHSLESIFDLARKQELTISKEIFISLFHALDVMDAGITSVANKNNDEIDDEVAKQLIGLINTDNQPILKKKVQKGDNLKKNDKSSIVSESDQVATRISVDIKRLDILMNLIEELMVEKLKISNLSNIDESAKNKNLVSDNLRSISKRLNRIVSDLQYNISYARMVPLDFIFLRFPRLIRDTAKALNKEVNLEISGGRVEMDRSLAEMLSEPLVHLIKNSIDHGIELPEKRQENKKSNIGKITITAKQERGLTKIIVKDDGRGIDWVEIAQIANKNGIITSDELKDWLNVLNKTGHAPKELIDIVYRPDFSTKNEVTQVSGRGVGLAIVKNFINRVGGRVEIETKKGEYSQFILEIPSTISATDALLVQVGEEIFAIPFALIERSIIIKQQSIKSFTDNDVAIIGEEELPLIWMRKFFNLPTTSTVYSVVIVNHDKNRVGLVIDKIISEQAVVIKPFSRALKTVQGFSGATILGNGKVALVVDVASLIEQTLLYGRALQVNS